VRPSPHGRSRAVLAIVLMTMLGAAILASPAQAGPGHFYGVVAQGLSSDEEYELMEEAGVGTLRFQLGWPLVQSVEGRCQASPRVGTCDWSLYDHLVGSAAARGIEFFPYLLNVPEFIDRRPDTPPVRSKRARKAWTQFVAAAVERYGPDGQYWQTDYSLDHPGAKPVPIRHWQVWNEPSAAPFWHPKPKPREYGKLVKITSTAITGVDKGAYIVLGGLFGTPIAKGGGIIQPKFIRAVYKVPKIERYFHAIAIHPYGPDLKRVRFQVDWARTEIRRAGDRKADLWISEIGWASDRVHNQLGVGKKGQARMLTKALSEFRKNRKKWRVRGINWYAWQDSDAPGLCDFCRRSGLVDLDGEPKPSYDAFRKLAG
jgi:hypothetical protein